ncbi:hypothetical protein FGF1_03410 [Flavobacteriaceae bacterium GF1]
MSKYVESVANNANTSIVATGGIDKQGLTGAYRGLIWTSSSFSFAGNTAAKDITQHNTGVAAGNVIPLGKGKFSDQSTDATFFEDAPLNIRLKQTDKIVSLQFDIALNACTEAELQKMEGKTGRVFLVTDKNFIKGRKNDDGTVQGRPLSSIDVDRIEPTDDSPVAYATITMTFDDPKGDIRNPFEALIDWDVEEMDQVFAVAQTVANVSSNGATLTAEFTLVDALGNTNLTGGAQADFKADDEDGNSLTIASVGVSSNTYTVNITTALTKAYVSFDGIRNISGVLYYLSPTLISTT